MVNMVEDDDDDDDESKVSEPEVPKPEAVFAPARPAGMKHAVTMPELARTNDSSKEMSKNPVSQKAEAAPRPEPCCCCAALDKLIGVRRKEPLRPRVVPPRPSLMAHSPDGPVVVFDWDDTLLPTSFLMEKVVPLYREGPVPEGGLHYDKLAAHANIVRRILRTARQVARVAVVTLARRPWVSISNKNYFPGQDIEELLAALDIPVYYASEHLDGMEVRMQRREWVAEVDRSGGGKVGMSVHEEDDGTLTASNVSEEGLIAEFNRANPEQAICAGDHIIDLRRPDGATLAQEPKGLLDRVRVPAKMLLTVVREVPESDPYADAKRKSMDAVLEKLYGKSAAPWNAISIGDSPAEHAAMRQATSSECAPHGTLCKTVGLLQQPSLEDLSGELRILLAWLPRIVKHEKNFDLAISELDLV